MEVDGEEVQEEYFNDDEDDDIEYHIQLPIPSPEQLDEEGLSLSLAFGRENEYSIFVGTQFPHQPPSSQLRSSHFIVEGNTPARRKLTCDSFDLFAALQLKCLGRKLDFRSALLSVSQQYREVLMRCAEHPEADEDALLFRDYHTIWHLIEIMALQFRDAPRDGGHMAVYGQEKEGDNRSGIGELLLDWLNTSSPYPFDLDQFGRGVGGERGERRGGVIALAEEHPEYWSTLVMLVSRGRMEEASALLQRHSHYPVQSDLDDVFGGGDSLSSHPLFVVCQLMKQMLRFRKGFSSQAEWTRWHTRCNSYRTHPSIQKFPPLQEVIDLLCGDMGVLDGYPWYCRLIADVFLNKPWMEEMEVGGVADGFAQYHRENGGESHPLDNVFLHIFRQDYFFAISEIDFLFSSFWLPAHLIDLLSHTRLIEMPFYADVAAIWPSLVPEHLGQNGEEEGDIDEIEGNRQVDLDSFREYYLLEYAHSLCSHGTEASWQIPLGYMASCPHKGPQHLANILAKEPPDSTMKLTQLLRLCDEVAGDGVRVCRCWKSVSKEGKEVLQKTSVFLRSTMRKVAAKNSMKRGKYSAALYHYSLSGDQKSLVHAADYVVSLYFSNYPDPSLQHPDVILEAFSTHVQFPTHLELIASYRELHNAWAINDFKSASQTLVTIFQRSRSPLSIWTPLIRRYLFPLLEMKEKAWLDVQSTYCVMHCIEMLRQKIREAQNRKKRKPAHFRLSPFTGRLQMSDEEALSMVEDVEKLTKIIVVYLQRAFVETTRGPSSLGFGTGFGKGLPPAVGGGLVGGGLAGGNSGELGAPLGASFFSTGLGVGLGSGMSLSLGGGTGTSSDQSGRI